MHDFCFAIFSNILTQWVHDFRNWKNAKKSIIPKAINMLGYIQAILMTTNGSRILRGPKRNMARFLFKVMNAMKENKIIKRKNINA